jgi:hypothetical protein
LNKKLDGELARFARRRLEAPYPYLIVDARYEKVREDGVVRSRAVQVAPDAPLRKRMSAVAAAHRKHVRVGDVRLHLNTFGEGIPSEAIRRLRDGVIMTIAGYEKDPREIYEIPEVRSYWTKVQGLCPTVLYFAASEYPPALQAVFACIASRLEIIRQKDSELIRVCIEGESIKPMVAVEMSNHLTLICISG